MASSYEHGNRTGKWVADVRLPRIIIGGNVTVAENRAPSIPIKFPPLDRERIPLVSIKIRGEFAYNKGRRRTIPTFDREFSVPGVRQPRGREGVANVRRAEAEDRYSSCPGQTTGYTFTG